MPRPVLQAMVLADHVYQDKSSGKHVIAGTFTRIIFGKATIERAPDSDDNHERHILSGPMTKAGSPYLYFALVEVHGTVPLELKFVDLSDASVLLEAKLAVTSSDPVSVAEYVVAMPPLPVNKIGTFSLDLLHDGEILGSWRLSVQEENSK